MTPDEAAARRAAVLDELTAKWHARDCGCTDPACPVADQARQRADQLTVLAGEALRRRGWFP